MYKSLSENIDNESIKKYEEIELKHIYETEVLTADAVSLICRVYYTYSNDNCSSEDVINYCEPIIKHSSILALLNCNVVDILSNKDRIKEKIGYKCFEESSSSFKIKVQNIEFIL